MDEMFQYIFSNLKANNHNMRVLRNAVKHQENLNSLVVIFGVFAAASIIKQNKKITNLQRELEELKNQKGD